MTDLGPLQKLAGFVQISREMIEDLPFDPLAAFRADTRTPQQRAADELARVAHRATVRKAAEDRHATALANVDPMLRPVLELHAPVFSEYDWAGQCYGCDFIANYEGEAPDWPCRTWELAAGE